MNWLLAHWQQIAAAIPLAYLLLSVLNALLPWPKAQGVLARVHQALDILAAFAPNARQEGIRLSRPLSPSKPAEPPAQ